MSCGITPEHELSQMTTDYTLREGMSCGITPEHALSQMTQSCDPVPSPFLTASISYGPFTQADRVLLYLSSVSALRQSVGHQVPLHAQGQFSDAGGEPPLTGRPQRAQELPPPDTVHDHCAILKTGKERRRREGLFQFKLLFNALARPFYFLHLSEN